MANVRAMLRAELASRKPAAAPTSKKRKAADSAAESPTVERKRTKAEDSINLPSGAFDAEPAEPEEPSEGPSPAAQASPYKQLSTELQEAVASATQDAATPPPVQSTTSAQTENDAVYEAEWAALEREIASIPEDTAPVSALNAAATISAAPMTAEEIAAQALEEQSTQRGRRDAELAAEKEEAALALEEEFEEMGELEDRAKKLREKREMLRKGGEEGESQAAAGAVSEALQSAEVNGAAELDDGESDDDVDDEDFDEWEFGAR